MTRDTIIKSLKEVHFVRLDSSGLKDVMPLMYKHLEDMFIRFATNNKATVNELKDFQNGMYLIDIYFYDYEIVYFVGRDIKQLEKDPVWARHVYNDVGTETLAALLEAAR